MAVTSLDPVFFAEPAGDEVSPGAIQALACLGREEPLGDERYPAAVFVLRYHSAAAGGCGIVAKLHVPVGESPAQGWPVSVFAHGLGDPAADFQRWPFVGHDWSNTRGCLAGRWAHHGIATLTPWLPGAGPSGPFATYSPFSLKRNARAIVDGCTALQQLPQFSDRPAAPRSDLPVGQLDLNRLVLRADCVSTSLLIELAAQCRSHASLAGLRALVADDFQPSRAYTAFCLSRPNCELPGSAAASMWCIWARGRWSLAEEHGWPLTTFFTEKAIELFSVPARLPLGERPRMYAFRLAPQARRSLVPLLLDNAAADLGLSFDGEALRRWIFSPEAIRWMSLPTLKELVNDSHYQRFLAATDPYFEETIAPFSPGIPLLVVGRGDPTPLAGMPSLAERYVQMTLPRVAMLRSWGWEVRLYENAVRRWHFIRRRTGPAVGFDRTGRDSLGPRQIRAFEKHRAAFIMRSMMTA
jgi:hypothetical protein